MTVRAFWSYRRDDDASEDGRISGLARQVASEFEMLTGTSMTLFLDRDSLSWGADWQERIAKAVGDAVFFIPVYTPGYFQSQTCRQVFRSFVAKARNLGVTERILGITYIDVPDMSVRSDDEIKAWAATYQRLRIDVRWVEVDGAAFRHEASKIAQQLARLEAESEVSLGMPDGIDASEPIGMKENPAQRQIANNKDARERIEDSNTEPRGGLTPADIAARPLVFLCHSSSDKERVRALYRRLIADGINCWFDEENLLPGQDWDYQISNVIRSSQYVLVCLSKSSVTKRGYVQTEIVRALDVADEQPEGAVYIIPLRLEECEVPQRLRRWHWSSLFLDGAYERLLGVLKSPAIDTPAHNI